MRDLHCRKWFCDYFQQVEVSKVKKAKIFEKSVGYLEMPKMEKLLQQSSRAKLARRFFLSVHCIKRIDSMLPWPGSSHYRSQKTS